MMGAALYCGPAITPADFAGAWRFDPIAAGLLAALLWFGRAAPRGPLLAAAGVLALLYFSPLCALAASLFSARAAHHLVLVTIAAPLIALCLPARATGGLVPLGAAVALHTAVLWAWHLPSAYQFGIVGVLPYWAMQASLLGTGVLVWRLILDAPRGEALLALLALTTQMGMLGALLTFAGRPLYAAHLLTTAPFGLDPLDDQRLAGLIMWVPGALPYLLVAAFLAWRPLRRAALALQ